MAIDYDPYFSLKTEERKKFGDRSFIQDLYWFLDKNGLLCESFFFFFDEAGHSTVVVILIGQHSCSRYIFAASIGLSGGNCTLHQHGVGDVAPKGKVHVGHGFCCCMNLHKLCNCRKIVVGLFLLLSKYMAYNVYMNPRLCVPHHFYSAPNYEGFIFLKLNF